MDTLVAGAGPPTPPATVEMTARAPAARRVPAFAPAAPHTPAAGPSSITAAPPATAARRISPPIATSSYHACAPACSEYVHLLVVKEHDPAGADTGRPHTRRTPRCRR